MALTKGTGPFGPDRNGTFNFEPSPPDGKTLYLEDVVWRVRAGLGGTTIVDSRRAKRLHETGYLPVYYFPLEDVRTDLLQESEHVTHCPYKGDARYWSVQAGEHRAPNAVWN